MQFIILTFFYIVLSSISLDIKSKFCINCKFAINNINKYDNNKFIKCTLFPINDLLDEYNFLVTGINTNSISETDFVYCSTARQFNHMCGKEGKMYKKKS